MENSRGRFFTLLMCRVHAIYIVFMIYNISNISATSCQVLMSARPLCDHIRNLHRLRLGGPDPLLLDHLSDSGASP